MNGTAFLERNYGVTEVNRPGTKRTTSKVWVKRRCDSVCVIDPRFLPMRCVMFKQAERCDEMMDAAMRTPCASRTLNLSSSASSYFFFSP